MAHPSSQPIRAGVSPDDRAACGPPSVAETPPFRADHVGSLLRPPALLEARRAAAEGRLAADELARVEDEAIVEAVRMQEDLGLQVATDGELRRASWHMDFIYRLGGVERTDQAMTVAFRNEAAAIEFSSSVHRVNRRVHLAEPIFLSDFAYLRSVAARATPKLTIPSPSMVHYRGGRAAIDERVYPDLDAFFDDLAAAYAAEVDALAAAGCTYLQLDDTSLAYLNDPVQRDQLARQGGDPVHQHERYVRQINAAIGRRPESMAVTVHLCRGNFRSSWAASGGYDFVAEAVFGGLDVDGFFLEYDDERSGTFEPLRFVPPGKRVVLGLVTTKHPALEDKDTLKRRIDEASRYVPLDQLCLSPQCGFSSTVEGNDLRVEDERAKLALVVETAEDVWG